MEIEFGEPNFHCFGATLLASGGFFTIHTMDKKGSPTFCVGWKDFMNNFQKRQDLKQISKKQIITTQKIFV